MMKQIVILILTFWVVTVEAVTIYPNIVKIQGKKGERASIQFKVYGHPTPAKVEFVKVANLTDSTDTVLQTFDLGPEAQYVVPIDIQLVESKEFYLCAVLKQSQSMRLRTCAAVKLILNQ